ncbi:MAG: hypothetical protein M3N57_12100 [Actinomycetota bacterium]|nr:hypothetical protein [Actinomycetota bacterium]
MELGSTRRRPPDATDLAEALRGAAETLGHRPAITVLRPDRRDEQGFASLLRWTAKGAHLLELECLLEPGDRVRLHSPAGWPAAVVCLAAWWIGAGLTVDRDAPVAVHHEQLHAPEDADDVYAVGDAPDGTPTAQTSSEPWAVAVQAFPDVHPNPQAAAQRPALFTGGEQRTQAELLAAAHQWQDEGALGMPANVEPAVWIPAIIRPLVTGEPTVILAGVDRGAASAERVAVWAR